MLGKPFERSFFQVVSEIPCPNGLEATVTSFPVYPNPNENELKKFLSFKNERRFSPIATKF